MKSNNTPILEKLSLILISFEIICAILGIITLLLLYFQDHHFFQFFGDFVFGIHYGAWFVPEHFNDKLDKFNHRITIAIYVSILSIVLTILVLLITVFGIKKKSYKTTVCGIFFRCVQVTITCGILTMAVFKMLYFYEVRREPEIQNKINATKYGEFYSEQNYRKTGFSTTAL